jgi:hypothetical protein
VRNRPKTVFFGGKQNMSDINALRNELRNATGELNRLHRQMADMARGQEESRKRDLEVLKKGLQIAVEARDTVMARQYEARLREFEEKALAELDDFRLNENEEYRALENAVRQAEQQWAGKSDELEQIIDELKRRKAEEGRVAREEAMKLIREAESVCASVDGTPHEFFCPNRLAIYESAIKDAENLLDVGMNEAAAAVSISAQSGIEKLGYEIIDLRDEWERTFASLKIAVKDLVSRLDAETTSWAESSGIKSDGDSDDSAKKRAAAEINFWSKGEFGELAKAVGQLDSRIAEAEGMGLDEYLKSGAERWTLQELAADIERADVINGALSRSLAMSRARCDASCQRSDWANAIIDFFTGEINFVLTEGETGYRRAPEEIRKTECFAAYVAQTYGDEAYEEDVREWIEISFKNDEGTVVFVYIVPDEDAEKLAVVNAVLLYINYAGAPDALFKCEVARNVKEALGLQTDDAEIVLSDELREITLDNESVFWEAGKKLEIKVSNANRNENI